MPRSRIGTLRVPGARLHYEVCGAGPLLLLIPGGPSDAGTFAGLRGVLSDRYTVVTYDPRGLSGSPLDGEPRDTPVATFADDARRLLAVLGDEPAYVLGESGGAVVGLELVVRHPERVRGLVAHEPPCTRLLEDAAEHVAALQEVHDTCHAGGVEAAMGKFLAAVGFTSEQGEAAAPADPAPASAGEELARMQRNLEFFLGHTLLPTRDYTPEIIRLRSLPVMVTVGADSAGQLPHRAATALATRLGTQPVVFPGDHFGTESQPDAFARRLHEVLSTF